MSINSPDTDYPDNDVTDELPVLSESAVLDPSVTMAALTARDRLPHEEATGEHTARFHVATNHDGPDVDALRTDLSARGAKIESLEADIRNLAARWTEVERHLTEKDTVIDQLTLALAMSKRALDARTTAEQQLSADIASLAQHNGESALELDRLRQHGVAQQLELEHERERSKAAETQLGSVRNELTQHIAKTSLVTPDDRVQLLQEEVATLTGYIANRGAHWEELEVRLASSVGRIEELERELAHRATRQQAAEQLAQGETARADELRRELVAMSRTVESGVQEIAALRAAYTEPKVNVEVLSSELDQAKQLNVVLQAEVQSLKERAAAGDAMANAARDSIGVAVREAVTKLETELAARRSDAETQAQTIRAKERELERAVDDLAQMRRQHADVQARLEQSRADIGRLERTLIDKDRSLDSRNDRIVALQEELNLKLGALHKLSAMDLSLQGLDSKMSERLKLAEAPADATRTAPALVCLSGGAPRHYSLSKPTMTIGRSSQCDIQIFTHFVSREHAKLTVDGPRVLIEDLGSTNGLFVNAVRVELHELRHNDLVTVGETQFRFVEEIAPAHASAVPKGA